MSEKEVPVHAPARATKKAPSVVIVNTGDGKGKSTAAFGTALRAVARGWKVCVIQFIKSDEWKVGERQSAVKLGVDGKYSPSVTPTITYTGLPKGKHKLEVYLANNDHSNTGVEGKTTFTVK